MKLIADAYLQFLDKRWTMLLIGGGVLVVIVVIFFMFSSGGDSLERDTQRIADVQYLQSALTKYFQAKGTYPPALKNLVPTYATALPKGFPKPDGACKIGGYQYKKYASINTYELIFCIGEQVGEYSAGAHTLSPYGIK